MSRILLTRAFDQPEFYGCVQPLGIMYLASMLRERQPGRHEIALHDLVVRRETPDEALPRILDHEPDLVGISAMTADARCAHELARRVKAARPQTRVVLGGPYASGRPERILEHGDFDYVVVGEGEFTFDALVRALEAGNQTPDIPGLAYMKGTDYVWSGPCVQSHGAVLDSIPFPAWDLIEFERYWDVPRFQSAYARREYMSLFTSRGCPYRCTYCHDIFTKQFHGHSPERVLAEIDALVERHGVGELSFVDDIFNIDRDRAIRICEMIAERDYDLKLDFPNGVRSDAMNRELLEALKAAGTYRLIYAIETASPRLQRQTKKNVNLPRMKRVIEWTDELDIFVHGFFMAGFPSETRAELHSTMDYALDSRLHTLSMFMVNPYEGTELSRQVAEMGHQVNTGETHNREFLRGCQQLGEVPVDEIRRTLRNTQVRFYTSPRRIWRILRCMPSLAQLPWMVVLFFVKSVFDTRGPRALGIAFELQAGWGRLRARLLPARARERRMARARRRRLEAQVPAFDAH